MTAGKFGGECLGGQRVLPLCGGSCCYYFDLANVSVLCYYHTFQKRSCQELGNECSYIVPQLRTWLNKSCCLTKPSDLSG